MTAQTSPTLPPATDPPSEPRPGGPPPTPAPAGWRRWLLDWWPLLLLAVVAFAVRWPNLWYIPQFTDEVFDGQVAYGIWEGKRPLIGVNAYTGAFHYYLQAGIFWLIGPGIYSPRALMVVLGVGAVLATAVLGADLGRRAVRGLDAGTVRVTGWIGALVGGGLLATSAVHVITSSHLAWPHGTLPLYLTLAFLLLERAVAGTSLPLSCLRERGPGGEGRSRGEGISGGWALVGAGFCFGLAQQQHPTMLLLWPVFIGYVLWRGRPFFRTRWAYAAVLAFLIGVSPLIVYNLISDFGTLRESQEQSRNYVEGRDREGREEDFSYQGRAAEIVQSMPRILASAIEFYPEESAQTASLDTYLRDPRVLAYTAAAILGLVTAARLGAWSLPLAVAVFLGVLPLFPASHDILPRQGRYLMPLVPLLFAGVGGLAALLWHQLRTLAAPMKRLAQSALAVVFALFVLFPLVPLVRYERDVLAANQTNDRYFVTLGALDRQRRPDEPVVLDPTLKNDRTGAAGTAQRTFDFMMELRGVPRVMLEESSERIVRRINTPTALVLADLQPSSLRHRNNADAWTLEPLENDEGGGFTLWRITRR